MDRWRVFAVAARKLNALQQPQVLNEHRLRHASLGTKSWQGWHQCLQNGRAGRQTRVTQTTTIALRTIRLSVQTVPVDARHNCIRRSLKAVRLSPSHWVVASTLLLRRTATFFTVDRRPIFHDCLKNPFHIALITLLLLRVVEGVDILFANW